NSVKDGYNMNYGGAGGRMSDDVLIRVSKKLRGKSKSHEHRQKMQEAAKRYWAQAPSSRRQQLIEKNKSDEGRKTASEAQKRRWQDPAQKEAMSKRHKGKVLSDETRKKISESL